jgi:hypothetical protein
MVERIPPESDGPGGKPRYRRCMSDVPGATSHVHAADREDVAGCEIRGVC